MHWLILNALQYIISHSHEDWKKLLQCSQFGECAFCGDINCTYVLYTYNNYISCVYNVYYRRARACDRVIIADVLYTRYPIVARSLGLATLGRVRARAKVSCIQADVLFSDSEQRHRAFSYISIWIHYLFKCQMYNIAKIKTYFNNAYDYEFGLDVHWNLTHIAFSFCARSSAARREKGYTTCRKLRTTV